MFEPTTDAYFDSAHFLADYYGKCENLHGHRWKVTVGISGDLGKSGTERGMVCDFGSFKKTVRRIVGEFDHTFLVEDGTLKPGTISALKSEGFSLKILPFRTTAENLAHHFYEVLKEEGFNVSFVEVAETPNNRARYYMQTEN